MNLAFGLEYETGKTFIIFAGEEGSWALDDVNGTLNNGPCQSDRLQIQDRGDGSSAGSQGFIRILVLKTKLIRSRSNFSLYADGEF